MNPYAFTSSPTRFFRSLFGDWNVEESAYYREGFTLSDAEQEINISPTNAELLLSYARDKYEEAVRIIDNLEVRRDNLLKFTAATTAAIAAYTNSMGSSVAQNRPILLAAIAAAAATVVLTLSGRSRSGAPTQCELSAIWPLMDDRADAISHAMVKKRVALSLFMATRGIVDGQLLRAAHLNAAMWLMAAATLCLMASLIYR